MNTFILYPLLVILSVYRIACLPTMRMRLCVASNNPHRLQNQCVYCHNKKFQQTVRICTGTPYLPANVSLEEGFCMVRQCRAQMPLMRPEPFYVGPDLGDAVGVNVEALAAADDISYSPVQAYNNPANTGYNSYNAIPGPIVTKPLRRRPPAQIYVGRPVRPGKIKCGEFGCLKAGQPASNDMVFSYTRESWWKGISQIRPPFCPVFDA